MIKVLKGGVLIDGTGKEPQEDAVVVIEEQKISAVGVKGKLDIPKGPGITTVNLAGKTIMPGLIDTHLHLFMNGEPDFVAQMRDVPVPLKAIRAVSYVQRLMEAGFTTVRSAGDGNLWMTVALRDAINQGYIKGPRILASGYHLTVTGGHGYVFPPWIPYFKEAVAIQCDSVNELIKATRQQIANGVDCIKIVATGGNMTPIDVWIPQFTVEEMKAVVDEAHKCGKCTHAHAVTPEGITRAIRAGIDVIAHGTLLDMKSAKLMAEKAVFLTPTISQIHSMAEKAPEGSIAMYARKKSREQMQHQKDNFIKWVEAGIKIAMGTDAGGVPYNYLGENAWELELMVEYGLSEMDAIVASTKNAAEALHIEDRVGTIEAGKLADLIVVDGDPLQDIRLLQNKEKIKLVMIGGKTVVERQ